MTTHNLNPQWIVGFVDGEGSFNLDVHIHRETKWGLQMQPEFVLVQHERDVDLLHKLKTQFACGTVAVNRRDATSVRYHWRVKNLRHAVEIIVPFFENHPLKTKKNVEFQRWREICLKMFRGDHRQSFDDFLEIVEKGQQLRYQHYAADSEFSRAIPKKREKVDAQLAYLRRLREEGMITNDGILASVPKLAPECRS